MATAYIETTIPSYYVARPSNSLTQAARQAITRKWWDEGRSEFDLFTSQEVLDEAGRGEHVMADARMALLEELEVLEITERAGNFAKDLVSTQLIPSKAASDAVHIAVACVHEVDLLVTWNCKHIANPIIRERLRVMVTSFGMHLPVICTPEELLKDEDD